jgi:hypothetical protein
LTACRIPEELRSRAGVVFCEGALSAMRAKACWPITVSEGYTEPLEGDGWKPFPQPALPADPDALLLIQDAEWARPYQEIPGYTD